MQVILDEQVYDIVTEPVAACRVDHDTIGRDPRPVKLSQG